MLLDVQNFLTFFLYSKSNYRRPTEQWPPKILDKISQQKKVQQSSPHSQQHSTNNPCSFSPPPRVQLRAPSQPRLFTMPSKKKKSKSSKKRKTKATTNNLALTIDDLDEMQARNERQQQEAAAASRDPSDPSSVDLVNKTKDWPRRRREDMGKCESIAGSWLSFSLAKAKWIQLSSNKALHQAFTANRGTTLESVRLWMQHAEQTLCKFIVLDIILKNQKTVQQFHALGRGWVFILLQRSSCSSSSFGTGGGGVRGSGNGDFTKLKVWFESSTRVEVDHEMDMKAASLDGESRQQYVWGYNPQSEIVFFIKGLAPAR